MTARGYPTDIRVDWQRCRPAPGEAEGPTVTDDLDAGERSRIARLHRSEDRYLSGQAHSLLRRTASADYPAVPPSAWAFRPPTPASAPALIAPDGTRLFVSLTHCAGLVAVAVSARRPVGIDAEPDKRQPDVADARSAILHPCEPQAEGPADLLIRWCLKEALGKAVGIGLLLEPTAVALAIDPPAVLEMPPPHDPADWSMTHGIVAPGHRFALAWARAAARR